MTDSIVTNDRTTVYFIQETFGYFLKLSPMTVVILNLTEVR